MLSYYYFIHTDDLEIYRILQMKKPVQKFTDLPKVINQMALASEKNQ